MSGNKNNMKDKFFRELICFISAFLSCISLLNLCNIYSYNVFIIIILFLIFSFYRSIKINLSKKELILVFVFCFLISFSQVLGKIVYEFQYDINVSVFREFLKLKNIISCIGLFLLLTSMYLKFSGLIFNFKLDESKKVFFGKKIYIISFVIIILCWLPYFLVLFPGVLTPDSISQFDSVINGFNIVSDHHPVLHTVFVGVIYKLGYLVFNNVNLAVAAVSFVQMIIMASIFSYFIKFLNDKHLPKYILIGMVLYFSLSPLHAYYSVTMWKDVLFGGFVLLFIITLIQIDDNYSLNLKLYLKFIIVSLLMLLFRNNAIYMYIIILPFVCYHFKNIIRSIAVAFIIVFSVFFVVKGPIFNKFGISKSSSSEYIAMPLQQIGRIVYKGISLDEYEYKMVNNLIPVSVLKDVYNPMNVDSIKFNENYNSSYFDNNKVEYLKLWISLVIKHPSISVEAYLNSTLGYWYSNVNYWATSSVISENNLGIYRNSIGFDFMKSYLDEVVSREIPVISLQWSIGLCFIMIFLSSFIIILRKQYNKLYYYFPIFGIWLTMMIASPVFAEFRYIYAAYTCLPLLLLIPFITVGKRVY